MSRVNVDKVIGVNRVVIPTYTTAQRDSLTDVEVATLIFNKDTLVFEFFDGAAWTEY